MTVGMFSRLYHETIWNWTPIGFPHSFRLWSQIVESNQWRVFDGYSWINSNIYVFKQAA